MRGTRQALDRLGLGDFTLFNGAEQGEEFVPLNLFDVDLAQQIAREGLQVLRCLDSPAQHGVGVRLKHPGHGAKAETLGESRDGPYQLVGIDLLAGNWRAQRL